MVWRLTSDILPSGAYWNKKLFVQQSPWQSTDMDSFGDTSPTMYPKNDSWLTKFRNLSKYFSFSSSVSSHSSYRQQTVTFKIVFKSLYNNRTLYVPFFLRFPQLVYNTLCTTFRFRSGNTLRWSLPKHIL